MQLREMQANLTRRAAEALEAGLIDATVAKRILATSEAVTAEAEKYRVALASGTSRDLTHAILEVIQRLLDEAEVFLPDAELVR